MYSGAQKPGISTHTIRLVIGLIAITLPFLTSWLAGNPPLTSISASYCVMGTDWPRNIFVGFLIAISALLLAYDGTNKTEFYLSKILDNLDDQAKVKSWVTKHAFPDIEHCAGKPNILLNGKARFRIVLESEELEYLTDSNQVIKELKSELKEKLMWRNEVI